MHIFPLGISSESGKTRNLNNLLTALYTYLFIFVRAGVPGAIYQRYPRLVKSGRLAATASGLSK